MRNMWVVRSGNDNSHLDDFLNENMAAMGWNGLGDLTSLHKEEIRKKIEDNCDYKKGKVAVITGMLNRLVNEVKEEDYVVTYDKYKRIYYLGRVTRSYYFDLKNEEKFAHRIGVEWESEAIDRDSLSIATKNSLGSTLTLFKLSPETMEEFLKKDKEITEEEEEELEEEIKEDIIAKSNDLIADKIAKLDFDEMEKLVAGILRSMGYKTKVSPKGADRGKDILASPDGLGLEEPRIRVEVKHRKGKMGAPEVRSFIGGLRSGDKGIYVSTGGYTKEAHYEAERSAIPITLIETDELIRLIIENYENFDVETRTLVPLQKIYWVV